MAERFAPVEDAWQLVALGNEILAHFLVKTSNPESAARYIIEVCDPHMHKNYAWKNTNFMWLIGVRETAYWSFLKNQDVFVKWVYRNHSDLDDYSSKKLSEVFADERAAWRITTLGMEEFFRKFYGGKSLSDASMAIIGAFEKCIPRFQREVALNWVKGLRRLQLWPRLVSETPLGPWVDRVLTEEMRSTQEAMFRERENRQRFSNDNQEIFNSMGDEVYSKSMTVENEEQLHRTCKRLFADIEEWITKKSIPFLGGSHTLFAINRSRWKHETLDLRGHRDYVHNEFKILNAAGYSLKFAPKDEETFKGSFLHKLLDSKDISVLRITLGVDPEAETEPEEK